MVSTIPIYDDPAHDLVSITLERRDDTQRMLQATTGTFGVISRLLARLLLPLGDAIAKRWLEKSEAHYASEIHTVAEELRFPGIYALNLSYEWGCTSGVFQSDNGNRLLRILDWPFPELGRYVMVVKQSGPAGSFYNVTWPGLSGTFQAVAENRFAAALNQAPMRRHRSGLVLDWLKNRIKMWRSHDWPPAHLLRYVFEHAPDYADAKRMLSETPIALPVIYILCGPNPGEGCVIERLETEAWIREIGNDVSVCAANHFLSDFNGVGHGWMPRAIYSHQRHNEMKALNVTSLTEWFIGPMANPLSRLAMSMDFASGTLTVRGTEGTEILNDITLTLKD